MSALLLIVFNIIRIIIIIVVATSTVDVVVVVVAAIGVAIGGTSFVSHIVSFFSRIIIFINCMALELTSNNFSKMINIQSNYYSGYSRLN